MISLKFIIKLQKKMVAIFCGGYVKSDIKLLNIMKGSFLLQIRKQESKKKRFKRPCLVVILAGHFVVVQKW